MLGCVYTGVSNGVWGVYVFREFSVCRHCGDVLGCSFMASYKYGDEKWYVVCILMCSGCILCAVIDYKSVTSRDLNVNQFFNCGKTEVCCFFNVFFRSSSFFL